MNMTEENDPTPGQLELAKWMTTANGRKRLITVEGVAMVGASVAG